MKINFLILFSMLLTFSVAHSAETCEFLTQKEITLSEFVNHQLSKSPNSFSPPFKDDNSCFPQAKSSMIIGEPVCYLNSSIPVNFVSATSIETNSNIKVIFYSMRGTKQDLELALSYFSEYEEITDEYMNNFKGPKFFGSTYAWRNGDIYIVLGQHEPGYDPIQISLHLITGTKAGIEFAGTDLNTCK